MAHFRRLPSGRWQAIVKHPSGRQVTKSDPLKRVVADWAREQEAQLSRGSWVDPAAGRITVAEWHRRWMTARVVAASTAARNESHWRNHVEPRWGSWPLAAVKRLEVGGWVNAMGAAGVGAPTVHACVNLLSTLLQAAADEDPPLIPRNPCRGVTLPTLTVRAPEWFTHDEHAAVLRQLAEPFRTLVDLGATVGPRWGEMTALHGSDVDWMRGQASIWRVLPRKGGTPCPCGTLPAHRVKEHPKSGRSRRTTPLPPDLLGAMSALMVGRPREALIFAGPEGGPLDESNFRRRVWAPALARAKVPYRRPHVMRHTAATWLVQAGVDLYRVQALLGHEDYRTTERYSHHAPDAHEAVLGAWAWRQGAPGVHGNDGGPSAPR